MQKLNDENIDYSFSPSASRKTDVCVVRYKGKPLCVFQRRAYGIKRKICHNYTEREQYTKLIVNMIQHGQCEDAQYNLTKYMLREQSDAECKLHPYRFFDELAEKI